MPTTSDGPAKAGHNVPHAITVCAFSMMLAFGALSRPLAAQCVDLSKDPAGCQPSTFDTPIGQMPSVRVNRQGDLDPTSSEEDARAGAAALEKKLHLFRNFEHLHWVITVPSVKDAATGAWKGGDLDGAGDGRGPRHRRQLHLRRSCERRRRAGTRSTFSRSSRIRSAAAGAGRRDPGACSKAIRASTTASSARWSTRRRAAKTATSWFATPARTRSAGWRRTAST